MNEMIDTTATKTGLKRWHVIVAIFGKITFDFQMWALIQFNSKN